MTTILTDSANYTAIANAIRTKLGVQTTYLPSEMAAAIASISGGGGSSAPSGFAYYNGYLLPKIPTVSGYEYAFIRKNDQTGNYDLVLGDAQWFANLSDATLDDWSLRCNTDGDGSIGHYKLYSTTQTSPTAWSEVTGTSYIGFGTGGNRDVIWSSHDILDGHRTNVLLKKGNAVT